MEAEVIRNRIFELLHFNQWSLYRLSKESGIPYSSLNNLKTRNKCPSIQTLDKICKAFNISLAEFFNLEENPLRVYEITEDEQKLLNFYKNMSAYHKKLAEAYMQGLSEK